MSAFFPGSVATSLQLLTAINNTQVTLTVNAGIGDTSVTVDNASPLPTAGYLTFDDNEGNPETVFYTGVSGNVLTGLTRAADGTSAAAHTAGAHLQQRWNAAYHNIVTTELIAVEQYLSDRFGIGSSPVIPSAKTLTIAKTSGQIILGTTNTTTISATAPASSITVTIPDTGGAASFVMTAGTQTIAGATTFSSGVTISATTNQLVLGVTHTVTITSPAPSASRTYTIPDAGGAASFVMTAGAQTIAGATTFSGGIVMSGATIAMGANKITGVANGTTSTDVAAYGQLGGSNGLNAAGYVIGTTPQVLQNTSTSQTVLTASNQTVLTQAITPKATTHKVRVQAVLSLSIDVVATHTQNIDGVIQRNGSTIATFDSLCGVGSAASVAEHYLWTVAIDYLDSPASTSAQTYTIQVGLDNSTGNGTGKFNDTTTGGTLSSLTVTEIAL